MLPMHTKSRRFFGVEVVGIAARCTEVFQKQAVHFATLNEGQSQLQKRDQRSDGIDGEHRLHTHRMICQDAHG